MLATLIADGAHMVTTSVRSTGTSDASPPENRLQAMKHAAVSGGVAFAGAMVSPRNVEWPTRMVYGDVVAVSPTRTTLPGLVTCAPSDTSVRSTATAEFVVTLAAAMTTTASDGTADDADTRSRLIVQSVTLTCVPSAMPPVALTTLAAVAPTRRAVVLSIATRPCCQR